MRAAEENSINKHKDLQVTLSFIHTSKVKEVKKKKEAATDLFFLFQPKCPLSVGNMSSSLLPPLPAVSLNTSSGYKLRAAYLSSCQQPPTV